VTEAGSEKKSSAGDGEASRTAYSQQMEAGKKADLAAFRRLISEGRLYELLDWIDAGKPMRFIARYEKSISGLEISVPYGSHTEVMELLNRCQWTNDELESALHIAVRDETVYLIELLLNQKAPVQNVPFDEICRLMDPPLIERFVALGADPTKGDGFACGLYKTGAARPLLRFYIKNSGRIPGLEVQASLALMRCIQENKLRASVLLLWAKADLYCKIPSGFRYDYPGRASPDHAEWDDDQFMDAYALRAIGYQTDREFFEKLNLKLRPEAIPCLLHAASFTGNVAFFKPLIEQCPAKLLNDSERGSCCGLEFLVNHEFEKYKHWEGSHDDYAELIELLLKQGARWDPGSGGLRHPRNGLVSGGDDYLIRIVKLLYEYDQDPEQLHKLINSPKAIDPFYGDGRELRRDIQAAAKLKNKSIRVLK
jgi:hypothetical protein